jgi:hypothetical protein
MGIRQADLLASTASQNLNGAGKGKHETNYMSGWVHLALTPEQNYNWRLGRAASLCENLTLKSFISYLAVMNISY